jgi:branched-chain amino acid transport system permease protein
VSIIDEYVASVLALAIITAFPAMGLNMQIGYTGLLNLGIMVFPAIAGYTSAILTSQLGFGFLPAMIIGVLLSGLAAYLISIPSLRTRGDYFAIVTLGFGLIVYSVALNWGEVTRGALGISGIPKPEIFGFVLADFESFFFFSAALLIIVYLAVNRVINSPYGRILRAIREDEDGCMALGKDTTKYKITAFVLGAMVSGFGGSLFAHYSTFIDPSAFDYEDSVMKVFAVLLGGAGNLLGSVIGAFAIILLPEPLRFIELSPDSFAALRNLIFGLVMIFMIMFRGHGLLPEKVRHHL